MSVSGTPSERGAQTAATAEGYTIAFGILTAAMGEVEAWALWNRWTAEQREGVAIFAEENFGPQVRSLCDEIVAWVDRHA